jgi:CubicO group peptidase (beta-lactamase class C family)/predicted glycoside hydrolase/deacetylase ChbG (UPF0249 family)
MRLFQTFLLCLLVITSRAQQKTGPRLIVRGDDMGFTHSCNMASIESYEKGIETSVEVMAVTPWFPEAVRLLKENPGVDVGIHLSITSEWDNVKWRPLTNCPSLVDKNGYFFPMMDPNPNYPGLAIKEKKWNLEEIEKEFRAQIELTILNIPQVSHISGHMGSTTFDKIVAEMTRKLAAEYNLADVSTNLKSDYGIIGTGYDGPGKGFANKEASFISMLNKLEPGKSYLFVDHPAHNDPETQAIYHLGNLDVATDRQDVTNVFTSEKVKNVIREKGIELVSYNDITKALPRSNPETERISSEGVSKYLKAVKENGQDLHSLMILRHGRVVAEYYFGDNEAGKKHIMNSVSKTFTSMAVGFAIAENRLRLSDKVVSFFPDDLPSEISPNLAELKLSDLLTMTVGHGSDSTANIRKQSGSWERMFLALPIEYKPGTKFVYNTIGTYMLSAIVQKVTGEKLIDYLYPRLFRPLGIVGAEWETSPSGVNTGGWGLQIKTEDMAKLGQLLLQKGVWKGKQLLPESWINEATTSKISQAPAWVAPETKANNSDWMQGYGYQIWRCRHNSYRADGARGQFIIVVPEKDAIIVTTANIDDMQAEINLIWDYLLPGLK